MEVPLMVEVPVTVDGPPVVRQLMAGTMFNLVCSATVQGMAHGRLC